MLIPHLHFNGNCADAIELYEKAFNTKVIEDSIDYMEDGKIAHAAINIHGTKVFLNDALTFINNTFGNKEKSIYFGSIHLIVVFKTIEEMINCYNILKTNDKDINTFYETPYSKLCGNFIDKFGILWGFIVEN